MRWLVPLLCLSACQQMFTPSWVERPQVDQAMAKGDYRVACVGLKMVKDDELRTYTAQQLAPVPDPIADECICEAVKGKDGKWDEAVAEGLRGADRDEAVHCLADLAATEGLKDRDKAISILGRTKAPVARDTLLNIARTSSDATARALAVRAFSGDSTKKDALLTLLGDDDVAVRAAAATALGGLAATDQAVESALVDRASSDAEGDVRAAALLAARQSKSKTSSELACKLLLSDPAPAVRQAALQGFRGAKDPAELACLRKRMMTEEDDSGVRTTMLEVVKASPSDESGKILCDAIPFWLETYLQKGLPDQIAGTDIIRAQNDRDWQSSYACVQKALRGRGYSCYARQYVGTWMRELGGSAGVPKCPPPGM